MAVAASERGFSVWKRFISSSNNNKNCPISSSIVTGKMMSNNNKSNKMSVPLLKTNDNNCCTSSSSQKKKMPILLFDIMDTIVRDPFYHHVPAFFGMSMDELLESKHPTAWVDFEKGLIDQMELSRIFFKDGRPFDLEDGTTIHGLETIINLHRQLISYLAGLKRTMTQGYSYIEGVEELLCDLKQMGYQMHASTNYPIWYELIEEKLNLSTYLSWTFCSCNMGKRKPSPEFYLDVLKQLKVEPSCCVFIDDRMKNVEAAVDAGFIGIQFKNVDSLRNDLSRLDIINSQSNRWTENSNVADCLQ